MSKEQQLFNITGYCFEHNCQNTPDKVALVSLVEGEVYKYSYRELYERIYLFSQKLLALELPVGSSVTLRYPIDVDFIAMFFAAIKVGLVPTPVMLTLTKSELEFIIKDSDSQYFLQKGKNAIDIVLPAVCQSLLLEDLIAIENTNNARQQPVLTKANDPAYMIYSSGTTGIPKAVIHAQRVILGYEPARKYFMDLKHDDVVYHVGNPCWTYTMSAGVISPLVAGATAILNDRAVDETPKGILDIIRKFSVTIFAAYPLRIKDILTVKDSEIPHTLRHVLSAAEPLAQETRVAWQEMFGVPIYEALGMTECSTFISSGPTIAVHPGYIGKAQPGRRLAILPIDEDAPALAIGEKGLLAIHKDEPGLMLGYYHRPELQEKAFRGEWFITGDLVTIEEEGYYKHFGRYNDLLNITGGYLASPVEIETVIKTFPGVVNVACGLRSDSHSVNTLTAYIVTEKVADDFSVELKRFLAEKLFEYKVPHNIYLVDDLPVARNGKLNRAALKDLKIK